MLLSSRLLTGLFLTGAAVGLSACSALGDLTGANDTNGPSVTVQLECRVNADGKATNCRVLRPADDDKYNQKALAAATTGRFKPLIRDGIPLDDINRPITFRFPVEK